ncbi:MAG: hypothetical protein ACRC10_09890 [Thermoguttaceae bacterium]
MRTYKRLGMLALTLAMVVSAALVYGQPGPGGPGGPPGMGPGPGMMGGLGLGGLMAVFGEEGQKDLGVNEDQMSKLQGAAMEAFMESGMQMPDPEKIRSMSKAERQKLMEDADKLQTIVIGKVEKILDKDQMGKARERLFQAGGGYAGLGVNQMSQTALGITADQKAKLKAIQKEMLDELDPADMKTPDEIQAMSQEERREYFQKVRAKGEEVKNKYEGKFKAILTSEQQAKGDKLVADTPAYIKAASERRGPGPGGPGGPGGPAAEGEEDFDLGGSTYVPGQGSGGDRPRPPKSTGGGFPKKADKDKDKEKDK